MPYVILNFSAFLQLQIGLGAPAQSFPFSIYNLPSRERDPSRKRAAKHAPA